MRGNESSPHRRLFLYVCNAPNPCGIRPPRRTASAPPGHPPGHPGDMNVAPTWADCGRPVGAPLVTPGAGTAQWNPPRTEFRSQTANRGIRPPRRTPRHPARSSGRHECRPYVGGPWENPVGAPLVTPGAGTAQRNARERNSARKRQIVASARPGEPRGIPPGHPGDMNVAPTWADCGKPVGAPLVTPGAGTAQWNARKWNPAATGVPPGPVVVYFCK